MAAIALTLEFELELQAMVIICLSVLQTIQPGSAIISMYTTVPEKAWPFLELLFEHFIWTCVQISLCWDRQTKYANNFFFLLLSDFDLM